MTSSHIKLEIEPGQNVGPGTLITLELNGQHLRLDGKGADGPYFIAEVELTDLQLQALRGQPGKFPFQPTKL